MDGSRVIQRRGGAEEEHLDVSAYLCGHGRPPVETHARRAQWAPVGGIWLIGVIGTRLICTGKQCAVDSGGYTTKCRSVKPNPCDVRRRNTVLGLGHEKGSSSLCSRCLHSAKSFWAKKKRVNESRRSLDGTWTQFKTLWSPVHPPNPPN